MFCVRMYRLPPPWSNCTRYTDNVSSSNVCSNFSSYNLASELNPGLDLNDLYFKMDQSNSKTIPSISKNVTQFNEKQVNFQQISLNTEGQLASSLMCSLTPACACQGRMSSSRGIFARTHFGLALLWKPRLGEVWSVECIRSVGFV